MILTAKTTDLKRCHCQLGPSLRDLKQGACMHAKTTRRQFQMQSAQLAPLACRDAISLDDEDDKIMLAALHDYETTQQLLLHI